MRFEMLRNPSRRKDFSEIQEKEESLNDHLQSISYGNDYLNQINK
jgi:hypothetical protein